MICKLAPFTVLCFAYLTGCSTSNSATEPAQTTSTITLCERPESLQRYNNESAGMMYAHGSGTSRDLQVAYDKATLNARREIALMISAEIDAYRSQLTQEIDANGDGDILTKLDQRTEESTKITLSNVESIDQSEPCQEGDIFREYVVVGIKRARLKQNYQQSIAEDDSLVEYFKNHTGYRDIFSDIGNE